MTGSKITWLAIHALRIGLLLALAFAVLTDSGPIIPSWAVNRFDGYSAVGPVLLGAMVVIVSVLKLPALVDPEGDGLFKGKSPWSLATFAVAFIAILAVFRPADTRGLYATAFALACFLAWQRIALIGSLLALTIVVTSIGVPAFIGAKAIANDRFLADRRACERQLEVDEERIANGQQPYWPDLTQVDCDWGRFTFR